MRTKRIARMKLYAIRGGSLFVLALITFLFARGALRMYTRYSDASEGRAIAEANVATLTARQKQLDYETSRLSSDRGMEEELRKRYGVVREGEGVIEIVEPTTTPETKNTGGGIIEWLKRLF